LYTQDVEGVQDEELSQITCLVIDPASSTKNLKRGATLNYPALLPIHRNRNKANLQRQPVFSHSTQCSLIGTVLKDKSNIVRPPKQRSQQQVAPQIDNVRNHSQQMETRSGRRVANPTRARALVSAPARKQVKVTKPLPVISHPPSMEKSFVFDPLEVRSLQKIPDRLE